MVDEQCPPVRERSYAAAVPALDTGALLVGAGVPGAQLLLTALRAVVVADRGAGR